MPKRNAFIGGIRSLSPSREIRAEEASKEPAQTIKVNFEDDRIGILDLSYPRSVVWAKMIEYLHKNNRPIYVEIDPDTNIITKLYAPEAAKVWQIKEDEVVYVYFHTSQARHYLRRNHPDFQNMLNALQKALDTDTTILVTSTPHDFEIIDVRPLPSSFGIETPPGPPTPSAPDPSVSWDRAVELFNKMNALSCVPCSSTDPCIPFKYPKDGCWIRAHLMCYKMMAEGETPKKIWIDHFPGHNLVALSSNVPECQVVWGWHVAPTLMVKQNSGPDIEMVIDPSLCNQPVTLNEWWSLQGDPNATLTPSNWDKYGHGGGTATEAQANTAMEWYRYLLDSELCIPYGPPPYECPIVKKSFFIVDRSTISKDEIDAMLSIGSPAVIEAAFFVVVDGFAPADLGITNSTLVGVPNIKPVLTFPGVTQMTIEVMPNIGLEDPVHLIRRQRITWKYKISFTGTSGFVSELQELNLTASITSVTNPISTVSAIAKIYLIKQPNPYEVDGETAWLSTDLRVFQIKAGESKFGVPMGSNPVDAPGFIQQVITNLNSGNTGGQTFENNISTDPQTSKLELSEKVDNGKSVFNFSVARVRYRAKTNPADNVRVFFRLFPASTTSLEYNQSTTYRRGGQAGNIISLLGIQGGEVTTIPCFAESRIDTSTTNMNAQTDPTNVKTMPPDSSGVEVVKYFGCWLDINQPSKPQFPIQPLPTDGPFPPGSRKTIQELIRNKHQCLVSEIAFDPTPIPPGATPSSSDKLAQRNLAIIESANPGDIASHRIPHTFEIRPTPTELQPNEMPDELMIDWGNTPVGSLATFYLHGTSTDDFLKMALKMYRTDRLVRIDGHTFQCQTGGVIYIPIPPGNGVNFTGMITVDLPDTVKRDQVFTIVVRQVTNVSEEPPVKVKRTSRKLLGEHATVGATSLKWRRILGTFQVTIPVRTKEVMLEPEARLLSNLRWIQKAIPEGNRWFLVFRRYVEQIANRVDALGGDSSKVAASPSGEWRKASSKCFILGATVAVIMALFMVGIGVLPGDLMGIIEVPIFALLIGIAYLWTKECKPNMCQLLRTLIVGTGIGTIFLAILLMLGISAPQLTIILIASIGVTAVTAIVGWIKRCFQ